MPVFQLFSDTKKFIIFKTYLEQSESSIIYPQSAVLAWGRCDSLRFISTETQCIKLRKIEDNFGILLLGVGDLFGYISN